MENKVLPIFTGEGISPQIMDVHYLFWFGGEINRLQVMNVFNLSGSWASKLIGQYRKHIPEAWVKWDTRTRSFKKEVGFADYVRDYLTEDKVMSCYEAYLRLISGNNQVLSLPSITENLSGILTDLSSAINSRSWMEIYYLGDASDSLVMPIKILPTLIFKGYGGKWFVRGHCCSGHYESYPGYYGNIHNISVSKIADTKMLPGFQGEHDMEALNDPGLDEVTFDLYEYGEPASRLIRSYKCERFLLPLFLLENNLSIQKAGDVSGINMELNAEGTQYYVCIHAKYKSSVEKYLKAYSYKETYD